MKKSKLETLIGLLRTAFEDSNVKFLEHDLEKISVIVYDCMTHPGRSFHNLHHIHDVAKGLKGLPVIAAVFHDIVYYQVDHGFRSSIESIIFDLIEKEGESFRIKKTSDTIINKVHLIFGINSGTVLNVFNGLNEFLSASVAVQLLKNILSEKDLLKIAGLIESTIPFRKDPIIVLDSRFKKLDFTQDEIEQTCKMAVDFSNSDVLNFAEKDPRKFLDNTWNLISEANFNLRRGMENYSVQDYRIALFKTHSFFKALEPNNVFARYHSYPQMKKWTNMQYYANKNVEIGRKYLMVKLVSVAIVEAMANITGGNAPMSLFMGDIRRRDTTVIRMEDYLDVELKSHEDIDHEVMHILENGRTQESSFDMRGSPMPAFVYRVLGQKEIERLYPIVTEFFHEAIDSRGLLKSYPKIVLKNIFTASSKVCTTREEILIKTLESLIH